MKTTITNKKFSEMTIEEFNNLSHNEICERLDRMNLEAYQSMIDMKIDLTHTQILVNSIDRKLQALIN